MCGCDVGLTGGVSVHVREASRRQTPQAEAARDRDGHAAPRRHHTVAHASSSYPARTTLSGGM